MNFTQSGRKICLVVGKTDVEMTRVLTNLPNGKYYAKNPSPERIKRTHGCLFK
jgi:hypothetical protein